MDTFIVILLLLVLFLLFAFVFFAVFALAFFWRKTRLAGGEKKEARFGEESAKQAENSKSDAKKVVEMLTEQAAVRNFFLYDGTEQKSPEEMAQDAFIKMRAGGN